MCNGEGEYICHDNRCICQCADEYPQCNCPFTDIQIMENTLLGMSEAWAASYKDFEASGKAASCTNMCRVLWRYLFHLNMCDTPTNDMYICTSSSACLILLNFPEEVCGRLLAHCTGLSISLPCTCVTFTSLRIREIAAHLMQDLQCKSEFRIAHLWQNSPLLWATSIWHKSCKTFSSIFVTGILAQLPGCFFSFLFLRPVNTT